MNPSTKKIECRVCGQEVRCLDGHKIDEYEQDEEFNDYFYSCGTCIGLGLASALGSIIHHCSNPVTNGILASITEDDIAKALKEIA